jgi:hypothetical protein
MKKLILCLMATCLSLTLLPLQSNAATIDKPISSVPAKPADNKSFEPRYSETNAIDRSKLKLAEKKNMQQVEIVSTRHHHRDAGGVVYITGGGILLIVLLIVILL